MGYQRRVHGDSQDSLCILTREKMMKTFTSVLILGILAMLLADSCVGVPACGPDDDGGVDGMEGTRFGCPPGQQRGGAATARAVSQVRRRFVIPNWIKWKQVP